MSFIPNESRILLYAEAQGVTVLGPGSRYVVWVQGCRRRCVGCIAADARSFAGGTVHAMEDVARRILRSGADGLTISGGEPALQAAALARMIDIVRCERDIGVILYTGYRLEDLAERGTAAQKRLLSLVDLLIDGEYRIELDDGRPHRGSSNQRIVFLTEREGYYRGNGPRRTQEVRLSPDTMFTIGIPERLDTETLTRDPSVLASRREKQ